MTSFDHPLIAGEPDGYQVLDLETRESVGYGADHILTYELAREIHAPLDKARFVIEAVTEKGVRENLGTTCPVVFYMPRGLRFATARVISDRLPARLERFIPNGMPEKDTALHMGPRVARAALLAIGLPLLPGSGQVQHRWRLDDAIQRIGRAIDVMPEGEPHLMVVLRHLYRFTRSLASHGADMLILDPVAEENALDPRSRS